jgi:diaminopimelate decarboxylase
MEYKKKNFLIDGFKAKNLAEKFSTPTYCYSFKKIRENINKFKKSFRGIKPLICFAVKANPNKILLSEIGKLGLGADVVSLGELKRALKSGIKPKKIVFSGVGKTTNELTFAIDKKILLINAESESEIKEI